jgi:hypothetical protein
MLIKFLKCDIYDAIIAKSGEWKKIKKKIMIGLMKFSQQLAIYFFYQLFLLFHLVH